MKAINSKVVSVEIYIDDPNNKELVKQYKISATPTTAILDSQEKVLEYVTGKIEKNEFLEMLNKHQK